MGPSWYISSQSWGCNYGRDGGQRQMSRHVTGVHLCFCFTCHRNCHRHKQGPLKAAACPCAHCRCGYANLNPEVESATRRAAGPLHPKSVLVHTPYSKLLLGILDLQPSQRGFSCQAARSSRRNFRGLSFLHEHKNVNVIRRRPNFL